MHVLERTSMALDITPSLEPESVAILDEVVADAYKLRNTRHLRDFGL